MVGFILYPKIGGPWQQDDHTQMLIVTMIFTWHVMAACFIIFFIGILVFLRVRRQFGGQALASTLTSRNKTKMNAVNGKIEYRRLPKEDNLALNVMLSDTDDEELNP